MKYLIVAVGEISFGLLLYFVLNFTWLQTLLLLIVLGVAFYFIFFKKFDDDDDDDKGSGGAINTNPFIAYSNHNTIASPF